MATTKLYLDTRATKRGEPAPLKVKITKHGQGAFIPLDLRIFPSQWDAEHGRVKDNPNKVALNSYIQNQKQKIDNLLLQLTADGELTKLTAVQIKNIIADRLNPKSEDGSLFLIRFKGYMGTRQKQRTREIYEATYNRIVQFDPKANTLSFEQITTDWLTSKNGSAASIASSIAASTSSSEASSSSCRFLSIFSARLSSSLRLRPSALVFVLNKVKTFLCLLFM